MDLDLSTVAEPDRPVTVLTAYAALPVNGSLVVGGSPDLHAVRAALVQDHPASHAWVVLDDGRARVTKLAATALPRVLCDTDTLVPERPGALWRLPMRERDLDANVVHLPAGEVVDPHVGADLDVLLLVLHGDGRLTTELGEVEVRAGQLVWLPRRSVRGFAAGPDGLRYLTVHQRRQGLGLVAARP
jgi:quercetin dioxygenase-like cupin family protein